MSLFFIVGRGRSGSTLLARVLTQHSQICVCPEGVFALALRPSYGSGSWSSRRIAAFCRDLGRERRMHGWHLQLNQIAERLHAAGPGLDYARACEQVYRSYAEDSIGRNAPRWVGDKNPSHALLLPELRALSPDARFVHLIRDYRDNVRSYLEVPFDLDTPAALAERWRRAHGAALRASRAAPEHFLHVRYEDLLRDPRAELTRICAFLQLPFEPALLASGERVGVEAGRGWFQRPIEAIDQERGARQHGLTTRELADVERICGDLGERFGYARSLPARPLSAAGHAGRALGWASVAAERQLFGGLPLPLRMLALDAYRSFNTARHRGAHARGAERSASHHART